MHYSFTKSIQILERTPAVLRALLSGIDEDWTMNNEGPDTWSPYDVIGHLIHGERTDWMQRILIILDETGDQKFKPFDRFAQFEESKGKTLNQLLDAFEQIRNTNLLHLKSLHLAENQLELKGIHPKFGEVTLRNLLATWVAHDLDHIMQIVRVMAKQYKVEVGPWMEYLRILQP
jgi:uncharacterized damage-inducible protein DinB